MANKDECMSCENLIVTRRMTNVMRKDGRREIAASFSCYAKNMPLPTLTKYDAPGCRCYKPGENRTEWYEEVDKA